MQAIIERSFTHWSAFPMIIVSITKPTHNTTTIGSSPFNINLSLILKFLSMASGLL